MKKLLIILLALMLVLSLTACGGKTPPAGLDDGEGGQSINPSDPSQSGETVNQPSVVIQGDRIIATSNDGMGTTTVTEYIYKDATLSEVVITFQCSDKDSAENLYDQMMNGALKDTTAQTYANVKLDGKNIVCNTTASYAAAFAGMDQTELAAALSGGTTGEASADGGSALAGDNDAEETIYNVQWSEMKLPEGFPQLDNGVTGYTEFEGGAMLSWNAMSLDDLETMIDKLEEWSGLPVEVALEMEDSKAWAAESDRLSISINYFVDSIDAQVMITVQTF